MQVAEKDAQLDRAANMVQRLRTHAQQQQQQATAGPSVEQDQVLWAVLVVRVIYRYVGDLTAAGYVYS